MVSTVKRVFTQEYREQAVKLVLEQGKGQAQAARELDVHPKTYARWIQLAKTGQLGAVDQTRIRPVGDLEAENTRLRSALKEAKEDLDILKKASAYFAKHQKYKYAFIQEQTRSVQPL